MGGEPVSGSSYIIICNGRIEVAATNDISEKIVAASRTAARLTAFMQSYYEELQVSDFHNISTLQHQLMDYLTGAQKYSRNDVEAKVAQMFVEFDALEDKY